MTASDDHQDRGTRIVADSRMAVESRTGVQSDTPINIESENGFYAVYMTGLAGPGFALIFFGNGKIVGADAAGVTLNGRYVMTTEQKYSTQIRVNTPPNIKLLQGGFASASGESMELTFTLPRDFYSRDYIRIETPKGPINAKFARLRGIDE